MRLIQAMLAVLIFMQGASIYFQAKEANKPYERTWDEMTDQERDKYAYLNVRPYR